MACQRPTKEKAPAFAGAWVLPILVALAVQSDDVKGVKQSAQVAEYRIRRAQKG